MVTEADLADLPEPLAAYVRRSGAVGKPRVTSFYADFHGRIRSGPDQAWMSFTGKQVNTYGPRPQRVFIMDATRSGLPVTVLHSFADTTATMRAKVLSLFTVVDASGPEMDRGETVTVFNDLVVLAPGAIVDAPVRWTAVDARHVRGVFTDGDQTVSAELTFDAEHDLVDFVSEDRLRASTDGKSFDPQTWSTPLSGHRDADGRRVLASGEGRWHAPRPEGCSPTSSSTSTTSPTTCAAPTGRPAPAHALLRRRQRPAVSGAGAVGHATQQTAGRASVDLYWLPLGAGAGGPVRAGQRPSLRSARRGPAAPRTRSTCTTPR